METVLTDDATNPSDASTTTEHAMPLVPTSPLTVYFEIAGEIYLNNSVIFVSKVGEGEGALLCKTNRKRCCGTPPNRYGEFYYPSGDNVPVKILEEDFYRNRGDGHIRLNRRVEADSPTGRFSCVIPDAQGILQKVYIYLI